MILHFYTLQGEALFEFVADESSSHDWGLMTDNKLSVSFQLGHCVNLSPGSYVDCLGMRFYALQEYKPTEVDSVTWNYQLTLYDAASWMSVTVPLNLLDTKNEPTFIYTAPLAEHAAIIVANLNRRMGTDKWKVGQIIDSTNITVKYDGRYCSAILQELADDQNTEWWVDDMTLNIGRAEFGDRIELGYQNGLIGNITCAQADNMRSYAYLYPLGSTRNIDPAKYGYERLQLPNGQMFVDMSSTGIAELVEEQAFAGIYPRYEGTITSVRSRAAVDENGREYIIYYFADDAIPFDPNDYEIAGLVKHVTFQSGELMGAEFEVNYDADKHEFEIITQWPSDSSTQLPGGLLTPAVGDKYVVWNITMPDEYYPLAEQEFLNAAEKFAGESDKDISVYKTPLDYIEVQKRGITLRPGQKVRLSSEEYFPEKGYYDSRITRITRKLWYPDEATIDISAVRSVGSLSRIESSLQKAESRVSQLAVSIPAIVKSKDTSTPTDSSVFTSLRVDEEYLSRRKGGVMKAPMYIGDTLASASWTQDKGFAFTGMGNGEYKGQVDYLHAKEIFVGGIPFRKTANGQLFIDANVVFGGDVTMYGTDTVPAPSLFDGLPIDGQTIYWDNGVLKAMGGGGGGGVADSVAWANVYGKPTWITNTKPTYNYGEILNTPDLNMYALASAIPTNNDQLTNGAGYITASALNGYATQIFVNTAVNGAKEWVEEQQYLTEITSGDIESILGYQPYDGDTNRLGFLTSSALTPYFLTSNFTKANIKSTLSISDWALASKKPTYTASEVGALGVNDTATNANKLGGVLSGYRQGEACIPRIESSGVMEIGRYIDFHTVDEEAGVDYSLRIECQGAYRNRVYFPTTNGTLALTSDIPSLNGYAKESWVNTELLKYLPIAGGTINGSLGVTNQLTAGSIVSNGDTISIGGGKLHYNSSLQTWQLDGSLLVTGGISIYSTFDSFTPSDIFQGLPIDNETIYWDNGVLKALGGGVADSVSWVNVTGKPSWITATKPKYDYSEIQGTPDLSGYATQSWVNTALAGYLPKSGGAVNGTLTATGDLSANGMVRGTAYLSTGYVQVSSNIDASVRTSIFGDAGSHWGQIKAFRSGSSAVGSLVGAYASGILFAMNDTHGFIQIPSSANRTGEATIGGGNGDKILWSAKLLHSLNISDYALSTMGGTVDGDITATSFAQNSQRSLKNILSYDGLTLEQLATIKPIKFTWKDGRDNRYHVGGIADDVQSVIPEVVYRSNDILSMDYGNAAFYMAASLIKPVVDHEQRIKVLESENKALREEIRQLKQTA